MTPVISPWVFYLMYVCDNLAGAAAVLGLAAFIVAVVSACAIVVCWASGEETGAKRSKDIFLRRVLPISLAMWLAASLLPDKATLTKMIVAQNVTYERVEDAAAVVQTVYEDIMNLFEEDTDED
jgi:hypothetical protein